MQSVTQSAVPDTHQIIHSLYEEIMELRAERDRNRQRQCEAALLVYNYDGDDVWDDDDDDPGPPDQPVTLPNVIRVSEDVVATKISSLEELMLDEEEMGEAA